MLTVVSAKGAGLARITAQVEQVAAKDLAAQTALLGWLGILEAPISGRIAATLDKDGIQDLSGRLDIGAGALKPTETTTPIRFDQASITAWVKKRETQGRASKRLEVDID